MKLNDPLKLPCGVELKNRLAKSAMSEALGTAHHCADAQLETLYRRWSRGGAGLLITGNVMVDPCALGEPANVVIHPSVGHEGLKAWAQAGQENQTHLWVQLNHPGKQSPKFLSKQPVAPSAIALRPPLNKMFNTPRALTSSEIETIIASFAYAAKVCQDQGFSGVQIHGAHGYLVSQFLSPLHNQRSDEWGGSLENRMRFVVRIYEAIRNAVGRSYPISIKLNSADFQRGGFSQDESMIVAENLSNLGMDLIEISGGTYEAPEMTGFKQKKSTQEREAYFLAYCEKIRLKVKTPLMLTGGFRSSVGMNTALETGACDVIGLGRALAIQPEFANDLLENKDAQSKVKVISTGVKAIDKIVPLEVTWYTNQLHRMAHGKNPSPSMSAFASIVETLLTTGFQNLKRVRAK